MPSRRIQSSKAAEGRIVVNPSTPTRSGIPVNAVGVSVMPSGISSVPVSGEVAAVDANTPASNFTNNTPPFATVSDSFDTPVNGRR